MKIVALNWFGWSIFWMTPLIWRFLKVWLSGRQPPRQGAIRLWLGSILMLCASSALEASLRPFRADAVTVGHAIAATLTPVLGSVGAMLALLLLAVLVVPWLWGSSLTAVLASLQRRRSAAAPRRAVRATAIGSSAPRQAGVVRPGLTGTGSPRRSAPWHPAATRALTDVQAKDPPWVAPRTERRSAARGMSEWAEVERLIPTPAMRSRSEPPPERDSDWAHASQPLVEQVQRTQTHSVRIIRMNPQGHMSIHEQSVTEAALHATVRSAPFNAQPFVADVGAIDEVVSVARMPAAGPLLVPGEATPSMLAVLNQSASSPDWTAPDAPALAYAPADDAAFVQHAAIPSVNVTGQEQQLAQAAPSCRPVPVASATGTSEATGADFAFHAPHGLTVDLPGLDLLDRAVAAVTPVAPERMAETGQLIEQRLREFKVPVTVIGADAGPVITRFEVEPALGVRGSQIVGLMKDLARALGMTSIRVVETIPGKTCMGLELPNQQRQMIRLSEILEAPAYRQSASHLTLALGKDITGNPVVADLARAPHMLVAGTTGSGKSVAINAMILSLLYKATPAEVRLIMIDPKMLELSVYEGIPHLLAPVVTDMKLAANALSWCVTEMDKRYRLMSALGVRNLAGFNQKIRDGERREHKVTNPFSLTPDTPEPLSTLPLIVVVIDELADLMMVAGKKIEELIARLAQKARAAGIHLILATQRPSVDVITGLIKANIPTRVAFQVSSKIDSRTILDQMGAEALLGHGDMLFLPPGSGYPQRVHGAFVSDEEVHRVVEFLKQFGEPEYEDAILNGAPVEAGDKEGTGEIADAEADPLYDEAVEFVMRTRRASISSVQRQLRIGYNRAARLVEQMEAAGILSAMATNGSRAILAPKRED